AVAVVGERLDQHADAAGAVALVEDLLEVVAAELARALLDGALDRVLRHVLGARLLDRVRELEVVVDVPAALAGRRRNEARELREDPPSLGVDRRLAMLDVVPGRVAGHDFERGMSPNDSFAQKNERTNLPKRRRVGVPRISASS